jgi:outer membrane protein assembly factor BamB
MDSAWSMFCHDTRHTGQSPYSTVNNPGTEKWRFHFTGWLEDTPVIDSDGTIYCKGAYGYLDRYLYAIYPNGTEKWKFKTDGLIWGSSPAIDEDGTVYFGSWDCGLYALYPNGTLKWRFPSSGTVASSPAIDDDGIIYYGVMGPGEDKGRIYALYPNGTEKWHYDTGFWIVSHPAIGDDGTVYIGSGDSYLYAMYPNGTLRWRFKTGDDIHSHSSVAEDGTIYIGSNDEYLYAIYPNNGTEKWRFGTAWGLYGNPSIANDGTIYVGTDKLYAIYPNGTLRWSFVLGYDEWVGSSSPAISADGTIYVGTHIGSMSGGEIIAVNPEGTEKWRKRIANDWVDSSPSIAEDGTVYIGSVYDVSGGYLHAFNYFTLEVDAHGPYIGIINEPVQFTGSADGGYPPYSYYWNFGDDNTSEDQNPTHEYASASNYTVTLTVTDDNDTIATDATYAVIRESNDPPSTPNIEGETHGHYGEPYDYTLAHILLA